MEPSCNHAIAKPSSHPVMSFRGTPLVMDALDFFPEKTKEVEDDDDIDHHHALEFHVDVCPFYIHANSFFLDLMQLTLMLCMGKSYTFVMLLFYRPGWISLQRMIPMATDQWKKMMHWKLWMKRAGYVSGWVYIFSSFYH